MNSTSPEYWGFRSTGICQWMRWSGCEGTVESAVCCALPPCIDHAASARDAASRIAPAASRVRSEGVWAARSVRTFMAGEAYHAERALRRDERACGAVAAALSSGPRSRRVRVSRPPRNPMPAPTAALRTVRFGHSPDADDAYMFYGFHTGKAVIDGCRVEHVLQDIQSLNARALRDADLEITACSAHAYAHLADRYAVMACGASFGWGYGPVLVAREACTPASLAGRRVAIPGKLTTAALLLRVECPDVVPVEVTFDDIPRAVRERE